MAIVSKKSRTVIISAIVIIVSALFTGCGADEGKISSIAVFVPGVTAGSPTYEMMVKGVMKAVDEHEGMNLQIIEGGFNQGEWKNKVQSLASSREFSLIVTSNPAMPQICRDVSAVVPEQKFLILDGHMPGEKNMYTFRFNQMEQAYLSGFFAGMITGSDLPGANPRMKAGLIAGQEYPDMNQAIRPGFEFGFLDGAGLQSQDSGKPVDFRVVGNWYDPGKGADLAGAIYDAGADVILAIAGGANMGVISAAKERGTYVLWFDSDGYATAPGTVIGSTYIAVDRAAYEKTKAAIEGTLPFGSAETGNIKGGWVTFVTDNPLFKEYVPGEIQKRMELKLVEFKNGNIEMPMPVIQ